MSRSAGFLRRHHIQNLTAAVLLSALLFAVNCSRTSPSIKPEAQATNRTFVDEANRSVSVPARIERVISLAPNLTETIYAVGAGDRLVGNTTFCNYPAEAKNVTKVGDTMQPDIERVLALKPQLVLVSTASQLQAFTRQLDEHGIAVFVTDPHDLAGVMKSIRTVGELLNQSTTANDLLIWLQSRIDHVERSVEKRPRVSVFFQLSGQPLYTAGRQSFVTDLIERAGGHSVTADLNEAWPKLSDETALASQPEAIVMLSGEAMGASANKGVASALRNSPAAKAGRVFVIDGDLLTRPGPRLVDGLEKMAYALHPEAFK